MNEQAIRKGTADLVETRPRNRGSIQTPLHDFTPAGSTGYTILAKVEALNPGLSVKDRVARNIVSRALEQWDHPFDPVLVEASSGNTGVSVSLLAHDLGLDSRLYVPESAGRSRIERMRSLGSHVTVTPADEGTEGARTRAVEASSGRVECLYLDQHGSEANVDAHRSGTGPEILGQLEGRMPDTLVLAVGTGGTLIGLSEALLPHNPAMRIVAVVPSVEGGIPGMRRLDPGGVPLHRRLEGIPTEEVDPDEAAFWIGYVRRRWGVPAGYSSGAAMAAAVRLGRRDGGLVLTLFPDHGFNYG